MGGKLEAPKDSRSAVPLPVLLTVIRVGIIPFYVRRCEGEESRFDSGSERSSRLFRMGLVYLYSWYVGFVGEWEPQNP
jgi:hypothetical protein